MEREGSSLVRLLVGVLGVAGILVGLFVLAVASFADGSTGERVVTIAIGVAFVVVGVVLLRFALRR
ncbi:MAG TPA: hypothetical protein VFP13_05505 [Actinomycetota bacterium]|nr:hypothetical protein [Actinomycetota bacterium]